MWKFEKQWAKEAKIAIVKYPTFIWRPLSSEPHEYPNKPHLGRN